MKRAGEWTFILVVLLAALAPSQTRAQTCGGAERWPVKVGTDPKAGTIDLTTRTRISLRDLISLPEPLRPRRGGNSTRLDEETHVYVVNARLVQFKFETNDNDLHLLITHHTLNLSPGGPRTTQRVRSSIAELHPPT